MRCTYIKYTNSFSIIYTNYTGYEIHDHLGMDGILCGKMYENIHRCSSEI